MQQRHQKYSAVFRNLAVGALVGQSSSARVLLRLCLYKVALNGLSNVYTYNVALGTKEEEVAAFVPDLTSFNFPSAIRVLDQFGPDKAAKEANLRYEPRQETLTVRPLDNFKFERRISLIKIDG